MKTGDIIYNKEENLIGCFINEFIEKQTIINEEGEEEEIELVTFTYIDMLLVPRTISTISKWKHSNFSLYYHKVCSNINSTLYNIPTKANIEFVLSMYIKNINTPISVIAKFLKEL